MIMMRIIHDTYVIIYGFFGLIITLILVNALVGPVDGSGGLVNFNRNLKIRLYFWRNARRDIYECEKDIQEDAF